MSWIRLKKLIVFLIISIVPGINSAMMCPSNFKMVEVGFTIKQVINLCGEPDDQEEYSETITLSESNNQAQALGNARSRNNVYQAGSESYSQNLNDTKQKVIIHTKLIYNKLQPTTLFFENNKLVGKELIR